MTYDELVYNFILEYFKMHLYAPTQREIQEATGASSATVSKAMHKLLREGKLETDHKSSPRAIRISAIRVRGKENE